MCRPGEKRQMEVDWPDPKRQRLDVEDSALWGLCDALLLYASGHGLATSSCCQWWPAIPPGSPDEDTSAQCHRALAETSLLPGFTLGQAVHPPSPHGRRSQAVPESAASEPLLRTLTQLANVAATGASVRRQLVAECHVQAPLLRLMQTPWAQQPLVMERCCRLLHWLCARAPENRETLAAHHSPCLKNGARSVTFVDAVLGAVEAHACCREVLSHALRALVALLPCLRVREELLRAQQRLLSCLTLASEALDAASVHAVCRWLPGVSSQVRRARGRPSIDLSSSVSAVPLQPRNDLDIEMADVTDDL